MNVAERDVVGKQDFMFKTKTPGELIPDTKYERNCLVLKKLDDRECYYLTLATHCDNVMEWYKTFPEQHYLLHRDDCIGLPKSSLVSLENIYKGTPFGKYQAIVSSNAFEEIIEKLFKWQNKCPSDWFIELKAII